MSLKDVLNKRAKQQKRQAAKKIAIASVLGAAAGAVAGILTAPKAGKETRQDIADGAKKAYDVTRETAVKAKEVVEKKVESFKKKEEGCCCEAEETTSAE